MNKQEKKYDCRIRKTSAFLKLGGMIMEEIMQYIYEEKALDLNTLGILLVEYNKEATRFMNQFDSIILVVVEKMATPEQIKHFEHKGNKIALHIIDDIQLREQIKIDSDRQVTEWILKGKIILEREQYMLRLKTDLRDFPFSERKIKLGLEFAKLIRFYLDGKHCFEHEQYLEAYTYAVQSLNYLGKLAVIEGGVHPKFNMWDQVKEMEPEIYKLYEELIKSNEPIEKRLELLFLACDFFVHSKTPVGIRHFLEILQDRPVWKYRDILLHPQLKGYEPNLCKLLEYMLNKDIISIVKSKLDEVTYNELHYQSKQFQFYC